MSYGKNTSIGERMKMISIIIPVLNETEFVTPFVDQLKPLKSFCEILFVDGGSDDETLETLYDLRQKVVKSNKGRAVQMNAGAKEAQGEFLLFLHVDINLPKDLSDQLKSLERRKIPLANFKLAFDNSHWFLKFNTVFSYLTYVPFQFGDQGLWVQKDLFNQVNGFDESMMLIEDQDVVKRLKKLVQLEKINSTLTVSARKYLKYGIYKLQFVYFYIYFLYRLGKEQEILKREMERLLRSDLS